MDNFLPQTCWVFFLIFVLNQNLSEAHENISFHVPVLRRCELDMFALLCAPNND